VDSLPYDEQDLKVTTFRLAQRDVSAAEVVERLTPHLTPSRVARIEQVIEQRTVSVAAVVEHIYDIGNISAVMRSAESFGFLPFHIIERPGSKYKMSDRISRGTEKWLDIKKYRETEACFDRLHAEGYKIFATDLDATTSIGEIDLSQKIAVVMGNEHAGISPVARERADGRIMLPMYGFAQSFNISVAAALVFSDIHRVRRQQLGQSGDLSPENKLALKAQYFLRTLQNAELYFKS
jgi:tRNA (guanosine-2'-O-)-methyltransferase